MKTTKPTTATAARTAPEADIAQPAGPVAWQIRYTSLSGQPMLEFCGHNAIGDYRDFDPSATSTPLYAAPQAAASNAELFARLQDVVTLAKEMHGHWDADRDSKVGKYLLALCGYCPGYDKRTDEIHAAIARVTGAAA